MRRRRGHPDRAHRARLGSCLGRKRESPLTCVCQTSGRFLNPTTHAVLCAELARADQMLAVTGLTMARDVCSAGVVAAAVRDQLCEPRAEFGDDAQTVFC